ncbi:MAG: biotin transporter BioY [Hyphomicrobiaceae bacterium]
MPTTHASPTLLGLARPDGPAARIATAAGAMLFGVCLLTLSAKIQVPFWPVQMTMQTLVVLMLGMAYGSRMGAATVLAYLLVGAAGFPVFAGTPERGIGLAYMTGPTGGFLLGFLFSAWVVGVLGERGLDRSLLGCALAMLAGHAIISFAGVLWLAALLGTTKAIQVGFVPFLASSVLKTALGALALPQIWRIVERRSARHQPH